jgi:hypothetical protein
MTTELTTAGTSTSALSTKNKVGLVLSGLMGLGDVLGLAALSQNDGSEPGPPDGVLVFGAIMGIVTIAAVVYAWRTGNRLGSRVAAGTRILSAITSLPAFFVDDVPAGLVVVAGSGIVITVVAVWLLLSPPKPRA